MTAHSHEVIESVNMNEPSERTYSFTVCLLTYKLRYHDRLTLY